jgi:hypothetical protein
LTRQAGKDAKLSEAMAALQDGDASAIHTLQQGFSDKYFGGE